MIPLLFSCHNILLLFRLGLEFMKLEDEEDFQEEDSQEEDSQDEEDRGL